MAAYKCKIALSDGRMVEKVIVADSISMIRQQVVQEGGFLLQAGKSAGTFSFFTLKRSKSVKPKEFYAFNQEFAVLLKAGVAVVSAFDGIIENQEKSGFAEVLRNVRDDIAAGESVSGAFGKYDQIFSPLYVASIRAGESGGDIPGAIAGYIENMKRAEAIRQKIKAALIYPAILTFCSVLVVTFLVVFVVPAITGSFTQSGSKLPWLTLILLGISDGVKLYYPYMVLFAMLLFLSVQMVMRSKKGHLVFDKYYLKVPVLGDIALCYAMTRFSSTLSMVLGSGSTLNSAVKISSDIVGNRYVKSCIRDILRALEQGAGFAQSMKDTAVFPGMAVRMIAAGEEGGSLESVLREMSEFYEKDVEGRLTLITSAIEPLLMMIMGIVIGFIVLAMYMPIFQMAGTI